MSTTISSARVRWFKMASSRAELCARFGFIRYDGDDGFQAGMLEDLADRRLKPKYRKASVGRLCMLCGQHNSPEARGRNISDFAHVKDDPWIPPIDGGDGCRLQIRAGHGVDFPDDTAQRHSACCFVP